MGITVKSTGQRLEAQALSNKGIMREIGLLARERIIRRTLSGKDQKDAAFASYSEGYRKQKQAALGGSGGVNLQASGQMLNAIEIVEVTDDTVTLGLK